MSVLLYVIILNIVYYINLSFLLSMSTTLKCLVLIVQRVCIISASISHSHPYSHTTSRSSRAFTAIMLLVHQHTPDQVSILDVFLFQPPQLLHLLGG